MQLPLGDDPRTETLRALHASLIARFGRIVRPPEKRREPVWVLVQGVIGARSKTAVSNASTDFLLEHYGSWDAVAKAPLEELTAHLARQTFPEQSARRLKDCLLAIAEKRGKLDLSLLGDMPTAAAMEWLETLPGVARKNSAGVMNTSTFDRSALVIDGHHRRVMQRMGLVPARADTTRAYDELMPVLPPEWSAQDMDEHHLLVKKLGQTYCRPSRPDCTACLARGICQTGRGLSP
ncbi:endonuclease III [Croceicoccus estronivorus]|uniref:endonuclease III domain-containing protein n=1 Tax=Croceicoccus estronivorus TaxID=1172626 RepID=UPI0008365123|nr:endonuclease III [Croceicoccus estronivorus]OCC23824.1 endonuclease III [Croceicoccus estronivorus]